MRWETGCSVTPWPSSTRPLITIPSCAWASMRPTCGAGAFTVVTPIQTTITGADTRDKINVRELKEYAGQLARILLRLSHVPPQEWPDNPQTEQTVAARVEAERGQVIRVHKVSPRFFGQRARQISRLL